MTESRLLARAAPDHHSRGAPLLDVPTLIAAAGDAACAAWKEFVAGDGLRPSTRKLYRNRARHFLAWLEPQGIGLAAVTRATVESYLDSQTTCAQERAIYSTPLRRLFAVLMAHQAIPSNPAAGADAQPSLSKRPPAGTPSLAELKGYVHELALDPIEEGDEDFEAALLMLAALHFGARRVLPLSHYTGVKPLRAAEFACRLRDNGVWTAGGKTAGEWMDEDGRLAFWLDVWVATGLLKKGYAPEPPAASAAVRTDPAQAG